MIIVIKSDCPQQEIELLFTALCRWSIVPEVSVSKQKLEIILVGDTTEIDVQEVKNLSPFIEQVIRINKPLKLYCFCPASPIDGCRRYPRFHRIGTRSSVNKSSGCCQQSKVR
jgi:DAHP synthase ferredoxin-like domain